MHDKSPLDVAETLSRLAAQMHNQPGMDATLRAIVEAAAVVVPGIRWAGVSLVRGKTTTAHAPSDAVAHALTELQSRLGEGPVVDVLRSHRTVVISDLTAETRWPRFVAAATERGVRCLASFRLFVTRGGDLGALTLYGPTPATFDDEALVTGELLAQHAAIAMAGAQAEEQMQRAIASRDIIGQAKGIIMERFHVNAVRAFEMLTRISQEDNIKLLHVAQRVIDTTNGNTSQPTVKR